MIRRLICGLLACLLLCGCAVSGPGEQKTAYDATFLTVFDTVTAIKGYAAGKEEFSATAQKIHDELLYYHQLFDIYQDYEGINNLKTVNDQAGIAPVQPHRSMGRIRNSARVRFI